MFSRTPTLRGGAFRLFSSRAGEHFDVIVCGGGIMGAWTACMAARTGASVALADQFDANHAQGSSHGDGRIYRLAYTDDIYVDMMLHSLPLWNELSARCHKPLIARTGGLNIYPTANGRARDLLETQRELFIRRGIAHEHLCADAVNERFPQFGLTRDREALYQVLQALASSLVVAIASSFTFALELFPVVSLVVAVAVGAAMDEAYAL